MEADSNKEATCWKRTTICWALVIVAGVVFLAFSVGGYEKRSVPSKTSMLEGELMSLTERVRQVEERVASLEAKSKPIPLAQPVPSQK